MPELLDGVKLRIKAVKDVTLTELNKDSGLNKLSEWLDSRFKMRILKVSNTLKSGCSLNGILVHIKP